MLKYFENVRLVRMADGKTTNSFVIWACQGAGGASLPIATFQFV